MIIFLFCDKNRWSAIHVLQRGFVTAFHGTVGMALALGRRE